MFHVTQGKGFQIDFANGLTVSVQFGPYNYCDHDSRSEEKNSAENAEVAVFYRKESPFGSSCWMTKKFVDGLEDDDVIGYRTPEQVAEIITRVAAYKN